MALEIEHKYLVINDSYLALCDKSLTRHIIQGYLSRTPGHTVRVRMSQTASGSEAFITVKGVTRGDTRVEYEYPVPPDDARAMLDLCEGEPIAKTRYYVPFGSLCWEVDIFEGRHSGLKVAEVELPQSTHDYEVPPFAGREVTGDPAYYNSAL